MNKTLHSVKSETFPLKLLRKLTKFCHMTIISSYHKSEIQFFRNHKPTWYFYSLLDLDSKHSFNTDPDPWGRIGPDPMIPIGHPHYDLKYIYLYMNLVLPVVVGVLNILFLAAAVGVMKPGRFSGSAFVEFKKFPLLNLKEKHKLQPGVGNRSHTEPNVQAIRSRSHFF